MLSYKVPQAMIDQVARDGLPRLVTDERDPAIQHVLYLEDERVRSMLATDWPPPLPSEPTQQQIDAAIAARALAAQQERAAIAAIRQQILDILQPLVGTSISTPLTNAQMQAFIRLLIFKEGGITPQATWAPLTWVKQ